MFEDVLRKRSDLLQKLRTFFYDRGFIEVETPIASREVIPELQIEPVKIDTGARYLQASPELHMKQLLCKKSGPIFQVTRAFRNDELGDLHRPEFTMVEWYLPGDDMWQGIELLSQLVSELLDTQEVTRTSYQHAFYSRLGINPHTASTDELKKVATKHTDLDPELVNQLGEDKDEWLNLLLCKVIEPTLGINSPEVLYHYPASQAALAKTVEDNLGFHVAERFEIYVRGIELANGYHELTDAVELEKRLNLVNDTRVKNKLSALPMPQCLLDLMRSPGLPASAGVALGFDRLLMLVVGAKSIDQVLSFPDP